MPKCGTIGVGDKRQRFVYHEVQLDGTLPFKDEEGKLVGYVFLGDILRIHDSIQKKLENKNITPTRTVDPGGQH